MRYEIRRATAADARMIAPKLRTFDRRELAATGISPRRVLLRLLDESPFSWTAFVDGEIAAIWGCSGSLLSTVGEMWLATTPAVERVPMAFVREAKAHIGLLLETKSKLVSGVIEGHNQSLRLWQMLGFRLGGVMQVGTANFRQIALERGHGC